MQAEIEAIRLRLLQVEKQLAIGQLMPGITHEINNSVASVVSNLDAMRVYFLDVSRVLEEQNTCIEWFRTNDAVSKSLIEKKCQQLDQLKDQLRLNFILSDIDPLISESLESAHKIGDILADLSVLYRDNNELKEQNLNSLLEKTLSIMRNELKYTVEINSELEIIPPVLCRAGDMIQVFFSLLMNTCQFIAVKNSGIINLRSGIDAGMVWVEISDTGIGITQQDKHKIFDPIFTTNNNTGIGLYNVKTIIEELDGCITVVSEENIGISFRLLLPEKSKIFNNEEVK